MPKRNCKVLPLCEKEWYVQEKKTSTDRVQYYPWVSRFHWGSWKVSSVDKGGLLYIHYLEYIGFELGVGALKFFRGYNRFS